MMDAITANSSLPPQTLSRLQGQARELEGVFLNTLMKEMFATAKPQGEINGGFGEETWRGMQAEQLANTIADSGGIGLAESILPELIRAQEAAMSPAANSASFTPYSGDNR